MKIIFATALATLSVAASSAFATTVQCSTLNDSPAGAGYYVEINGSSAAGVANLSHTDATGKDTFPAQNYDVTLTFDGQRLTKASGENFTMDFVSPYDTAQDTSRGDFSLKATLTNGRTISLKTATFMCQVLK